jgi:hypothetical protein
MIAYRDGCDDVDLQQLAALFESVGWNFRTRDAGRLARMVRGSMYGVSALDGDKLVGFAATGGRSGPRAVRASRGATGASVLCAVRVSPGSGHAAAGPEPLRREEPALLAGKGALLEGR